MRLPGSLSGRLLLGALVVILLALLVTGAVMSFALQRFIQGQIDGRLDGQILTVTDALRSDAEGRLRLERTVDGPPFERPLSGWYWEVLAPGPVLRSQSLPASSPGFALDAGTLEPRPHPETVDGIGPGDESLRVRVKRVQVGAVVATIAAAAPLKALAGPLHEALTPLFVTLLLLAAGLIGGVLLQVRVGLRPLTVLRDDLVLVRTGRAERITGPQPSEIRPLVTELNTLLEQNAANLERARRHVANLGHGLKTPLATLALALEEPGLDPQGKLRPLVVTMDRRIRHHLSRARAAALGGSVRARTILASAVADHAALFAKLFADKAIRFEVEIDPAIAVACEAQDVDEMLGNLMDNACKWAAGQVRLKAVADGRSVCLSVEDDGPGLTESQSADVLRPGRRIDESTPGYGFGLPITHELAELHGGSLELGSSELGGLKVVLRLPQS
jgi:signal transduction histidine kinase